MSERAKEREGEAGAGGAGQAYALTCFPRSFYALAELSLLAREVAAFATLLVEEIFK